MLVIRLSRGGAKKKPFYPIIVTRRDAARDSGNPVERLGYLNPFATGQAKKLVLDKTRLDYWVDQGAQLSERVAGLVKSLNKELTLRR